jgi:uncharacterized protein
VLQAFGIVSCNDHGNDHVCGVTLFESTTPMALRDNLNDALKQAMKARDSRRVSTLRLVFAALKDREIRSDPAETEISDADLLALLAKMIKQREESASAFESGGRPELAAAEREEIAIIREFMPRQLSEDETRAAVRQAINDTGAAGLKDMGKVMAALKQRYTGTMDFAKAGPLAKELLANPSS